MEIEIEKSFLKQSDKTDDDLFEIPRIPCDDLSYHQFFCKYMMKNLPLVIKGMKVKTKTSSEWFDVEGKLNLAPLHNVLGNCNVPVANCSKQYFDSHDKIQMTFGEYLKYWNGDRKNGELYLKDFHLKQEIPSLDFYNVPFYFASDWLNEFLIDTGKDDYRFIYIGPKNTWTPFHSDVFGSYSWSANIYGSKQWLLLPPGQETKLKDSLGKLPFTISEELLQEKGAKYFNLIQGCDETLFVPSKWFHQVRNLEDTVSINHNWFNGCNVHSIVGNLIQNFNDVEREISDCKDMENYQEHCQLMLKSVFGMNFFDLVEMLQHIADKRIKKVDFEMFGKYTFGKLHNRNDLEILLKVFLHLRENIVVAKFDKLMKSVDATVGKINDLLN